MKVRVDEDRCTGVQNCIAVCPEIFEMRDDTAVAKVTEVPPELEDKCRDAADSCPMDAIEIEE